MQLRILGPLLVLMLSLWVSFYAPVGAAGSASIAGQVSSPASTQTLPLVLMDDRGRNIRLNRHASRIVSLSPSITELVFEAGAGSKLVGVSRYSDYPEAARSIPNIGDASNLDLERIVALRPDLVIAWRSGNAISDIEKLEKLGLAVFAIEAARLNDIPRLLRIAGQLAGTSTQAESTAGAFEETLHQIRRSYGSHSKIRVFQLIWHQPLMTVNGNHVISDILELCGGVNIFGSAPSLTPLVSVENLLEADPQVIISSMSQEFSESEVKALLGRFSHISAIRRNNLYFVHPDLMHRQTARVIQAAKIVCAQLESARLTLGAQGDG
ncbi:cobalamin-binding protein [Nitrosovibrio tenuis]|uniref:Iron complex transport system substrate-binding protein n=1 Tax=Nitrosovibrio tenuis TaxID=1233 RepID=A0A1H7P3Y9_9PROT|nr:cobalamin-binding protein [Nitrosovibrio tenuis]SEL29817.1 iron complex transport system substrate-binding protein [Nitrosovibrio tenuis]